MKHRSRKHHRLKPRVHMRSAPGSVPGTLSVQAGAEHPQIRVIAYDSDRVVDKIVENPNEIADYLDNWPVTWVNVSGLGDRATLESLAETFHVHTLALEDVVNVYQRAKVELYPEHVFCVLRAPWPDHEELTTQFSMFVGKNYVLTFQEKQATFFELVRGRIHQAHSQMRTDTRADYLAYRLVDTVVDSFFPIFESIGNRLDKLDDLSASDGDISIAEVQRVKRSLLMYKRVILPMREAIAQLRSDASHFVSDDTRVFLRDCYDHVMRLSDLSESYREICSDLRDFHIATVSNRMNDVMKTLTIISTIFIPLSFIAGVYGMNFDPNRSSYNMPELSWSMGYPGVLTLMAAIAVGMLYLFKRRGWIGAEIKPDDGHET